MSLIFIQFRYNCPQNPTEFKLSPNDSLPYLHLNSNASFVPCILSAADSLPRPEYADVLFEMQIPRDNSKVMSSN